MKTFAILIALALVGSTMTASTCTAALKCTQCTGTGDAAACQMCYGGFIAGTGETTACTTTSPAGCLVQSDATTCTFCEQGKVKLIGNQAPDSGALGDCVALTTANAAVAVGTIEMTDGTNQNAASLLAVACVGLFSGNDCTTAIATADAVTGCTWHDAQTPANCWKCDANLVRVANIACSARTGATDGCLITSATTTCDGACDGSANWWALAAGVCTKFSKIAGAFAVVALFFANF